MSSTEYPQPQRRGGALPFGEWMLCGKFGRESQPGTVDSLESSSREEKGRYMSLKTWGRMSQLNNVAQVRLERRMGTSLTVRVAGSSAREG